jgi:zinc protease
MAAEGVAPGTFSVYIASAPDKVEQATRGILDELARLREQRVPEDELERARRSLVGNFAIEQQRSASHAAHISLDALYGLDPLSEARYAESVAAVTSDDVMRVAQRILRLDAYTLARVGR